MIDDADLEVVRQLLSRAVEQFDGNPLLALHLLHGLSHAGLDYLESLVIDGGGDGGDGVTEDTVKRMQSVLEDMEARRGTH